MPYPSTVTVFTNPLASNRLNAPSHSSIETAQNTGLTEIQTFVGTNSSAVGTLIYDIRATASDGGGHVQTANKGGTGQTSYTKGDLLVASSSSVLTKLAVGAEGQTLISSVGAATGMVWGNANATKIAASGSLVGIAFSTNPPAAYSVLSVVIPASVLSTNNVVRSTTFISNYTGASGSVLLAARYGSNQVASIVFRSGTASVTTGRIDYTLIANGSDSLQRGALTLYLAGDQGMNVGSIVGFEKFVLGTSSVNSSANQTLGLTMQAVTDSMGSLQVNGYIVEKIV